MSKFSLVEKIMLVASSVVIFSVVGLVILGEKQLEHNCYSKKCPDTMVPTLLDNNRYSCVCLVPSK